MGKVDPRLTSAWDNSKIKSICASLKNFKGSVAKYAYDKKTQIYSVNVSFQGKSYLLTTRLGPEVVEMMLSDSRGNPIEHAGFVNSELFFKKGK